MASWFQSCIQARTNGDIEQEEAQMQSNWFQSLKNMFQCCIHGSANAEIEEEEAQMTSWMQSLKNMFQCCIPGAEIEEEEEEEAQPEVVVAAPAPPTRKALVCSAESLINLENDQRRLSADIMKMEAQGEEITASFIGEITYTVIFSGSGLLFGNPLMPCAVVMTFVCLILIMFVLVIALFFIVMIIKTGTLNSMLNAFNVRRLNIIQGAREFLEVENNRDPNNPEDPNLVHPTTSHQSVTDRLTKKLESKISITLKKFYCQIFWLTIIYVGIYGSILVYVAWYTFCTIRCGCVRAALDAAQVI